MKLTRRTVLKGAGISVALPALEQMILPRRASAQAGVRRFLAFCVTNGPTPETWHPAGTGPLTQALLTPSLQDMAGFAAENIWPAGASIVRDVTLVSGIDHQAVCSNIHSPSMTLSAHGSGGVGLINPTRPTLDQLLVPHLAGQTPFPTLTVSGSNATALTQGYVSFAEGGVPTSALRDPAKLFDTLFGSSAGSSDPTLARIRRQRVSILDFVRNDAKGLISRLGTADKVRVEQHLQSVSELEKQLQPVVIVGGRGCTVPGAPTAPIDYHAKCKQLIDLTVLALACDQTRIATLQYASSYNMNFVGYDLGEDIGRWSDHFLSHKLGDRDRAKDLDGIDPVEARRKANARVILTSRFKVRRFAYLLNAMKAISTPTGTLLDESLVLYASENGNGDTHGRRVMPVILAGHAGGFRTGRRVAARAPTGGLHCSILNYLGVPTTTYGDPAAGPIAGL